MSYFNSKRSESSISRISGDGYTTEDGDDRDDTKRRSRNLSEKKRRDRFNILINELCSMVSTSRKMDKSTVLKATIAFLRANTASAQGAEPEGDWQRSFLTNEEFCYLMLEAMDGFILVLSESGNIIYISESVTTLLGHMPSELMSTSMYDLIPADERTALFNILTEPANDKKKIDFFVTLNIRLGRLEAHQADHKYQLVKFNGYYKRLVSHSRKSRRENRSENGDEHQERQSSSKEHVLICTGRLLDSDLLHDMSTVVASSDTEFSSRHSLEWKFLFLDHRGPPIIGYLPFEVLGTSGYDYYHAEDLEKVAACHEEVMRKGEGTSCYYRFLTKGQQWIWLQSRFYITHNQWNSKPELVACIHRVVSYEDVLKEMRGEAPGTSKNSNSYLSKSLKIEHRSKSCASSSSSRVRSTSTGNTECGSVCRKRSSGTRSRDREILPKPSNIMDSSVLSMSSGFEFKSGAATCNKVPDIIGVSTYLNQTASHIDSNIGHQNKRSLNSVLIQEANSLTQLVQVHPVPVLSLPLTAFHLHPVQSGVVPSSYVSPSGLILTPTHQQHLLLKQAELQRQIFQQQEELRLITEQLLIDQTEMGSMLIPQGNAQVQPLPIQLQEHQNREVNLVQQQFQ